MGWHGRDICIYVYTVILHDKIACSNSCMSTGDHMHADARSLERPAFNYKALRARIPAWACMARLEADRPSHGAHVQPGSACGRCMRLIYVRVGPCSSCA